MDLKSHPTNEQLERFVLGRTDADETGRSCSGGDPMDEEAFVKDVEQAAQDELFEAVANLKSLSFRLLGVGSTLPESASARQVVECVVVDAILPAIRDLTAAAEQLAESA